MELSISNIAWDIAEDEVIAKLLNSCSVKFIDIAPSKYFSNPVKATNLDIINIKEWWAERNIKIAGMQSLLFGSTGLNIFASLEVQKTMLEYLDAICRIGAGLGARQLVFGSPKNRDCTGLNKSQIIEKATVFFRQLGDIAQFYKVIICLEPNPVCYGCNFMTNSFETIKMLKMIDHPSIKMQFDTGALTINNEECGMILQNNMNFIGHVHISEPELLPIGDGKTDHKKIASALELYLPNYIASIEMLPTRNEPHMTSISRALNIAIRYYRNNCMNGKFK